MLVLPVLSSCRPTFVLTPRADPSGEKPLPLLPGEVPEEPYYPYNRVVLLPSSEAHDGSSDGPLVPQSLDNPDEYYEYSETSSSGNFRPTLSRITEVSETGDNVPPSLPSQGSRTVSTWSSQTDYGQVIGAYLSFRGSLLPVVLINDSHDRP